MEVVMHIRGLLIWEARDFHWSCWID
jgi:hypothetical protein